MVAFSARDTRRRHTKSESCKLTRAESPECNYQPEEHVLDLLAVVHALDAL